MSCFTRETIQAHLSKEPLLVGKFLDVHVIAGSEYKAYKAKPYGEFNCAIAGCGARLPKFDRNSKAPKTLLNHLQVMHHDTAAGERLKEINDKVSGPHGAVLDGLIKQC